LVLPAAQGFCDGNNSCDLALMEAASFCAGVWHKRYSGQQERYGDGTDICAPDYAKLLMFALVFSAFNNFKSDD